MYGTRSVLRTGCRHGGGGVYGHPKHSQLHWVHCASVFTSVLQKSHINAKALLISIGSTHAEPELCIAEVCGRKIPPPVHISCM
jgi:hypothetical protein